MELSDITNHHHYHQGRRSRHQNRHRKHHVAHTASDQRGPVTQWPTREEHAREGNKQSLVDTWLEDIETPRLQPVHNTESLSKEPSSKARSRPRSTYQLQSPSPRRVFAHKSHNGPVSRASPRQFRRQRNRCRDLVQDNAKVDVRNEQDTLQVQPGLPQVIRPVSVATESDYESGKKRPHTKSEGSVVSVASAAQHHFEKKARYKTRSDRYDTTRVHDPRKAGKKKRKKPKDQSRRKEVRRAGDFFPAKEVMDNFNSESILSDRITMQPTVRPGLFDNGRASKNQLPDLTFHEMHFRKRPPPPKPVPRGHERAKRRGQRELEEVSAFFLHKGIPESSGISGRAQPEVGGASSIDRATRDGSSSSIDAPPHQTGPGEQYGHMSPALDIESSRGATNWTWSSSYVPPERGIAQVSVSTEHVPAQSSTPPRAREALERTGIFDNTGIRFSQHPERVLLATSRSKSGSSKREPLVAVSSDILNRQSDTLRQDIRIVRYHDRGVMASEEAENIAGCRQQAQGIRQNAVEQPSGHTPARITASANGVKCSRFASEDQTVSLPQVEGSVNNAAAFHAADHDTELERPRSPKCTVVKQLEAAAENVEWRELQNYLARGRTSLPVQEDVQSASGHHFQHFPSTHDDSQHGRLGIKLGFAGDRQQLDLCEANQENDRLNTIADGRRDSQHAHEVNLTPRFAMKSTSGNSPQVSNIEQPAIDVQIPSIAYRGPSGAHPGACYNVETPSSVHINPPSSNTGLRILTNNWAASGHGQLTSNYFLAEEQSVLPEAAGLSSPRCSRQQSLAEYIALMENEVLGRPQEDDPDGHSPIPSWLALQDNDAVHLTSAPQAHQSYVGAYERDLSEDVHMRDRSIGGNLHGNKGVMRNSDVDREEQIFMSTFWRPNCS